MTYFGFLLRFLGIPIVLLGIVAYIDHRRGRDVPSNFRAWPLWAAIVLHVVVAVVYTTPWDNYLVATGVWYYNPALVTGLVLGWVPIEEYTFFVVETILAGLWIGFLMRRMRFDHPGPLQPRWRIVPVAILGIIWLGSVALLISGWPPGTYLSLLLAWALPPIMLQLGFGGDILRRYGRLVLTVNRLVDALPQRRRFLRHRLRHLGDQSGPVAALADRRRAARRGSYLLPDHQRARNIRYRAGPCPREP